MEPFADWAVISGRYAKPIEPFDLTCRNYIVMLTNNALSSIAFQAIKNSARTFDTPDS